MKKFIIIAISLIIVFILVYFFFLNDYGLQKRVDKDSNMKFKNGETIFYRTSVWGATGDHVQISISGAPIEKKQPDSKKDIILNEPIIFYKQVEDSLKAVKKQKKADDKEKKQEEKQK